jgi:hypothetical protein
MNECDALLSKVDEIAQFLNENRCSWWAERLRDLIAQPEINMSVHQLRGEIRKLFGAMGSLNDIKIYFENDLQRTKLANLRLEQLLDSLFELVRDEN